MDATGSGTVIDAFEAERLIQTLKPFPVHDIGSSSWLKQHHTYEQLNLAAHFTARTNSDNYVLAAALTFDKLPILVHSLLSVEVWRENIFPSLLPYLTSHGNTTVIMRTFFILHNECVLSNLLECLLYHDYAAEALGDSLLDLIDYCSRRVTALVHLSQQYGHRNGSTLGNEIEAATMDAKTAAALFEQEASDPVRAAKRQLDIWIKQTLFRTGVASLTILRYISDYCTKLPLSMMTRLLDTHDIPLLVVPLIENPPWVRRITKRVPVTTTNTNTEGAPSESPIETKEITVWQKYDEHQWKDVEPQNLLKLTQIEGQPWLMIHALLLEPECRRRYQLSSHRKSQLGRLRKYLNELLVDQLPILVDLQRYIDETTITGNAPDAGVDGNMGSLLLETVPVVRESIIKEALQRITTENDGHGWMDTASTGKNTGPSSIPVEDKDTSPKDEGKTEIRKGAKKITIIEEVEDDESTEETKTTAKPATILPIPTIQVLEMEEQTNSMIDLTNLKKKKTDNGTGKRTNTSKTSGILTKLDDRAFNGGKENAWSWDDLANYIRHHSMRLRSKTGTTNVPLSSADTWPDSDDDKDLRRLGALYTADSFDEMALGAPKCAKCGQPAEKRCSRCQNEWYCSRQCQVAAWKGHKTVCDIVTEAMKK